MNAAQLTAQDMRRALAHYPTGVAVLTAQEADTPPVSMVVGTFTSVSLEPPLVGFLADRNSNSWRGIRAAGHFCASVLGSGHEQVCRAFASKAPNRFEHANAVTGSGRAYLRDAVLWVDCDIVDVLPAGDHDFVLGGVRELGVGEEGGLPLVFLRGGYGLPQIASLQVEAPGLGAVLRMADAVRPEIERVARTLGVECVVLAVVDGEVIMLAAAGVGSTSGGPRTHVGSAFPLAAPLAAVFTAWAGPEQQQRWVAEGTRFAGSDVSAVAQAALAAVRGRGYEIATGPEVFDRLRRTVAGGDVTSSDERTAQFSHVLRDVAERDEPALTRPLDELGNVALLMVPVRDRGGQVVLSLGIVNLGGRESPAELRHYLNELEAAAERASRLVGELPPA